ncbi:PAP13 [Symbiodinium pilosum]|uniref:PAP13 protein n=1 Tax=Symbiodinium pilosum TaxID=2952 RepID=A0A812UCT2_SYMPI|nr:PAP13 [Symbiodinium pilosum]
MGVPMLRPTTPGSPGSPNILALNPAWLDIFRFCSIRDLGASLAVDRHWRAAVDSHHVWADAYDRTQRVDDSSAPSGENLLRSLIERPFGEDAVGWHVAVLAEDHGYSTERYYAGRVVAYSVETDTYLIAYDTEGAQADQPNMHWEQERRKRTAAMRHNPSLAGKSRFSFLSPPPHLPKSGAAYSSSVAHAEPSQKVRARDERSREPLRGSWKEELKHNVLQAPTQMLTQLNDHSDEVLFVVFSPCGTRLASCSRDLQTIVFKVQTDCDSPSDHEGVLIGSKESEPSKFPRFEREAIFTHQTAPCRAMWWPIPPYDMVAVSTEACRADG